MFKCHIGLRLFDTMSNDLVTNHQPYLSISFKGIKVKHSCYCLHLSNICKELNISCFLFNFALPKSLLLEAWGFTLALAPGLFNNKAKSIMTYFPKWVTCFHPFELFGKHTNNLQGSISKCLHYPNFVNDFSSGMSNVHQVCIISCLGLCLNVCFIVWFALPMFHLLLRIFSSKMWIQLLLLHLQVKSLPCCVYIQPLTHFVLILTWLAMVVNA
jgi:hypothetical protein